MKKTPEEIKARMHRNYLRQSMLINWSSISWRGISSQSKSVEDVIATLQTRYRVTAGYTTTNIRDYHDHWILWKGDYHEGLELCGLKPHNGYFFLQ